MPERRLHVISSAVIMVRPGAEQAVVASLAALPETEVVAAERNKIVVVLEGAGRGEVGSRLAAISLMQGVLTANMVFEHVEEEEVRS